jgi:hypothetical protein
MVKRSSATRKKKASKLQQRASGPSTSTATNADRPVRVYADGKASPGMLLEFYMLLCTF